MSVVKRTMDGIDYLQVRRKVRTPEGTIQKSEYVNVNGMLEHEPEYRLALKKAYDADLKLEIEQLQAISFLDHFYVDGQFRYIQVRPPSNRAGWALSTIVHKTEKHGSFYISRSISKYGLENAFNEIFNKLMKHLKYDLDDLNVIVLRAAWLAHLKSRSSEFVA